MYISNKIKKNENRGKISKQDKILFKIYDFPNFIAHNPTFLVNLW